MTLEVLRAARSKAPAVHVPETVVTGRVLEAARLHSARVEKPERYFDASTLEEADRQFDGRLGLAELIAETARANGYVGRERRVTPEMLRHAFGRELRAAAASTIDIGGILANVASPGAQSRPAVQRTLRRT